MTSPVISLNIMDAYRRNADSKYATFDLIPRKGAGSDTPAESCSQQPPQQRSPSSLSAVVATSTPFLVIDNSLFNPEVSIKTDPSRRWDSDVAALVSTKKWLQMYGLKRSRLDLQSLIRQIAFRHSDDFDRALKMPVCSRYGTNLFQRYFRPDGQSFNITVTPEAMKQLETRLIQAISLFKRRLNWLTSESRRIFGVIEEKSICIVLDFKDLTEQQLHLYLSAVERVLLEQVSVLGRFNLVRSAHDPVLFRTDLVNVTSETISQAVEWLWQLDTKASVPKSASVEALIKALTLPHVESVFLFSEGSATDGCREMLRERVADSKIPVHVVSYNCTSSETIDFLKSLAKASNARFHAYAVVMEMDTFERVEIDADAAQSNLVLKKKAYGGVPRGAGMREDVILLFEELEEAKNNLTQIQAVMKDHVEKIKPGEELSKAKNLSEDFVDETYMSSAQWLRLHGIQAKRLGFYEVLSSVAFRHQDGVIDLKVPPSDRYQISDASTVKKLINAKYCDKFAHVLWKDGQMMHVHVTPEFFRLYKDRLGIAMDAMQRRVDWLHRGSREMFGTVVENCIYLLIDMSASMHAHIQFVKDKLFLLMQEQLRHKQMINMIAFNSQVYLWQKSLVGVSEQTLQHGWNWVRALTCNGTTNTMGALQQALADRETQAVYLLTDGRPDQPPKSIIAQTKMPRAVPIHTISFNCNDREANEFLYELAKESGGRFHYYSQDGCEIDLDGPEPWQSEDIALLRKEIEVGWNTLEKIEQLKHDCELLTMCKDDNSSNKGTRKSLPGDHCCSDSSQFGQSFKSSSKDPRPAVSVSFKERSTSARLLPSRPKSAVAKSGRISCDSPPIAAHTRTSLLRTMSSGGHFASTEWMLPETKEMLERQEKRKKNVLEAEEKRNKQHEKKNKKLTNSRVLSSKKWLVKNGLIAKKLTIVDALAPTFISHEPKYVPILNKQVLSKVFDKVLPIGYLSEAKRRLHLVNPLAVDFNSYANKVKEAIELYKKRLDRIVWNALSEEQKQKFDSDFPISFIDNEVALMKALTESGWPVREKDLQLLMKEIRQGDSYIEQAMALKEAALKCGEGLPEYKEKHLKDSDTESEKAEKSKKKTKSEIKSTKADIKVSNKPVVERNLKVVARNAEDGFYYPGLVKENVDIRRSEIQFAGKSSTEVVPTRFIIPLAGAVTRPTLAVGDYVLCRMLHDENGQECYVPGRVMAKPIQAEDHGKFYAVSLYTGQQAQFLRIYLIKISHSRYQFTVRYVKEIAKEQKKKKVDNDNDQSSDEESQEDESLESSSDADDVDENTDEVVDKAEEASDVDEEDEEQKSGKMSSSRKTKDLREVLRRYIRRQIKIKKKLRSSIQKYCSAKRKGQAKDELKRLLEEIDRLKNVSSTDSKDVQRMKKKKSVGDFSPILEMRRSLSNLKVGEEVLARWSDDGWYYTGTVKDRCGDDCYIIQDSLGDLEKIWREDVIADDDGSNQTIRKGNHVIALHPDFTFSYCPGKVRAVTRGFVTVAFYDKRESEVAKDEVYLIPAEKYDYDVGNIVACEERWVGQVVVARNDDTGLFYLGRVTERFGDGRQYMIKWTDGSKGVQSATYIFGPFSKRQKLTSGDFVLADDDNADQIVYKPGIVRKGFVDFFDSSRSSSLDPEVSFLLTEDFHHNLVTFLKTRDRDASEADSKASSVESSSEEEDD